MHLDLIPARDSCPCRVSSSSLLGSITSVVSSSEDEVSSNDLSQTVLQHPLTANISTSSTGKGVWWATYYAEKGCIRILENHHA